MKRKQINGPLAKDARSYALAIGNLFMNFAQIEILTFVWNSKLGGKTSAVQKLMLADRIDRVRALVAASAWTPSQKTRAADLWQQAQKLSVFRNRIAHNPVCLTDVGDGNYALQIIDVRKIKSGIKPEALIGYPQLVEAIKALLILPPQLDNLLSESTRVDGP